MLLGDHVLPAVVLVRVERLLAAELEPRAEFAPRFEGGKKIQNARFLKVVYNGQTVQENVEIDGPTRAHMEISEAPTNPLMLQGDHGPVAFRNIWARPLQ